MLYSQTDCCWKDEKMTSACKMRSDGQPSNSSECFGFLSQSRKTFRNLKKTFAISKTNCVTKKLIFSVKLILVLYFQQLKKKLLTDITQMNLHVKLFQNSMHTKFVCRCKIFLHFQHFLVNITMLYTELSFHELIVQCTYLQEYSIVEAVIPTSPMHLPFNIYENDGGGLP